MLSTWSNVCITCPTAVSPLHPSQQCPLGSRVHKAVEGRWMWADDTFWVQKAQSPQTTCFLQGQVTPVSITQFSGLTPVPQQKPPRMWPSGPPTLCLAPTPCVELRSAWVLHGSTCTHVLRQTLSLEGSQCRLVCLQQVSSRKNIPDERPIILQLPTSPGKPGLPGSLCNK